MATEAGARRAGGLVWTGRVMSALVVAFLVMDAAMKLIQMPVVAATMAPLGWRADSAVPLGVIILGCAVLYAVPRTAVLGAVLLTGLFGGTLATHLRVGSPYFSHTFFGLYMALIAWGGLYLREPRLRALLPLRRPEG